MFYQREEGDTLLSRYNQLSLKKWGMKMFKKAIAVILSASMCLSIFTACGKGDETDGGASGDGNETSTEQTAGGSWGDYKFDTTKNLSNPNASDKANAVYNWLCSIEGDYIISGLQEMCGDSGSEEFTWLKTETGDLPGLRGLDFINGDYEGVVRRAKTWSNLNTLISICWHMGVPGDVDGGYNSSQETYDGLLEALNDPESEGYAQIVADIDKAAPYLQELRDANVVVLWRPFHEFDGKWFWWGKDGAEAFVKLWQLMYDRYTNVYELDNLIWVLGYTGNSTPGAVSWYPGDEYVDIIGADSYSEYAASNGYAGMYEDLLENLADSGKPATLHECGTLPNLGSLQQNDINWLWFLVWHSNYIENEEVNSFATVYSAFNSDYVLTLSEMPDFSSFDQ